MFSVIIPAYNSENTIEKALDSLRNQTKPELIREVIVINDGSADATADKVEQYRKRESCNLNIILHNQQNAGVAAARNAGIRMASADYLAFLDSDDCWVPEKLEWQEKILKQNPQIDLLCGGMEEGPLRILLQKDPLLHHLSLKEYCTKSVIFTSTVVIRRARVKDAGYFDESMQYCEDMNYYQRFFEWNQVYYLPEKLVCYGIGREYYGQNGLSSDLKEMHHGRKRNFQILREKKKISATFYTVMILFGEIKFFRRKIIVNRQR